MARPEQAPPARRRPRRAALYELGPGNFVVYHFHHGAEEMLDRSFAAEPTLEGLPDGERTLAEGDVGPAFPPDPTEAHAVRNETDAARPSS